MRRVLYHDKLFKAYATDKETYVITDGKITMPVPITDCVNLLERTCVTDQVVLNILEYFDNKEHGLSNYTPVCVMRASEHPDDAYLYHIIAKRNDGKYACWTSWNESTQSLNFGHYDLESEDEALAILDEHYHRLTID